MTTPPGSSVLEGVRVLDLTTVLAGPFPTLMMAEMGAEVIKVETLSGDTVRDVGPFRNAQMGALYLQANRGKRSVALNLKHEAGRAALLEVVRSCDVFVHNMRAQAISRLKLAYEDVRAVKPDIIYAAVSGFDPRGPYADKPAYDDLIQGLSGISDLTRRGSGGEPRYAPMAIADRYVGMSAFAVILGAIVHRLRTGRGQCVNIPMFETMVHMVLSDHLGGKTFSPDEGPAGYPRLLSAERRPYPTQDGHVCVMMYNDRQWGRFLVAVGRGDLVTDDPRFSTMTARAKYVDEVYGILAGILRERTTREWLAVLEEADVPAMPMHTLDSLLEDEQLAAVGLLSSVDHPSEGRIRSLRVPSVWSESQPQAGGPAPRLGQNTRDVLQRAGLSSEAVDRLIRDGIAFAPDTSEIGGDSHGGD